MKKNPTSFRFCIILAMLLCMATSSALEPDYGIHIETYPLPDNQKTSIYLDEGRPIGLNGKDLTLQFGLRLRHDNVLGTVVRIITDNNKNVDLLFSIEDDERYPNLVTGDKANLQTALPVYDRWVPVSMKLSPKTGNVELNYNGTVTTASYPDLKDSKNVRIVMGHSLIEGFVLNDVASVDLRDVEIFRGKEKIRSWKFKAHLDDRSLDELHNQPATVTNSKWIIDETAKWTKIFGRDFSTLPSVAFDPVIASFYMVSGGSNKLLVFHSPEGVTDTIVTYGLPHLAEAPNQLFFIPKLHILLSYYIDEDRFAKFDPVNHIWCNGGRYVDDHDFWNNSVSYNPTDSALVSFGGYGHYKFNNLLVTSYPLSDKPQKQVALKDIHPRRSCATTIIDDHLYIFGGWGCPSGRQELDTRNYYDLYRVNLKDNSVEQLWNLEKSPFGTDFSCLENLIYEPETDSFLMLTTLDGGTLLRVERATGKMERMSYPMHLNIDSHLFYGNLFYSQEQSKYYAAIVGSQTDGATNLSIFSLMAPAAPVSSLTQVYRDPDMECDSCWITTYIIIGVVALLLLLLFLYRRRRCLNRRKNCVEPDSVSTDQPLGPTGEPLEEECEKPKEQSSPNSEPTDLPVEAVVEKKVEEIAPSVVAESEHQEDTPRYYDLTRGCVRLFGCFQVFDKNGEDITAAFTPTLKRLLLVLIFYTGKNANGISSNRMLDLLWGDKEYDSAKNNRNVYLSRLRPILQQIGDVTIGTHNGFRNITFGDGTLCDYLEFIKLSKEKNGEYTERALELLFNGILLPNVEEEYVDTFKSEFSNEAIEFLTDLLRQEGLSPKQQMKIADTIFMHDFVNEDALRIKCSILHRQGRIGMARAAYDSFCKEYKILLGKDYPIPFNEIIE